jgi:hypothetical protein
LFDALGYEPLRESSALGGFRNVPRASDPLISSLEYTYTLKAIGSC